MKYCGCLFAKLPSILGLMMESQELIKLPVRAVEEALGDEGQVTCLLWALLLPSTRLARETMLVA